MIGKGTWDEISPENQEIVRNLAVENGRYASGLTIELGEEALKNVEAAGVAVSNVDLAPFKEAVTSVYELLDLTAEAEIVKSVLAE